MKYILNNDNLEIVGKQYLQGVGGYDGTNPDSSEDIATVLPNLVEITYSELKSLRDDSKLIPGQQYRITDYITTTTQENTQSAGHQFDIIVIADDVNVLNENARAIQHEGDTYFSNSDLNAWELKYCLDNDTERFAWADSENGKGVIYRMIDEWNNDCPYDFKNIQFKRYILEADDAFATDAAKGGEIEIVKEKLQEMSHKIHTNFWYYSEYISDVFPDANPETRYVPFGDVNYEIAGPQVLCGIDENNYGWFYTFHNEGEDASLLKHNVDENVGVYDNTIKDSCYIFIVEEGNGSYYPTKINAQSLNNIVFVGNNCNSNSFGNGCYSNSFGNSCGSNSFGNDCYYNSFGNDCESNSFGNGCGSNSFGNGCCSNNSFGNGCYNSLGKYCNSNSFGNDCYYNSFGNSCGSNSFGNGCGSNSFGNGCYYNSFGNSCENNSLGNECYENSFGGSCSNNSFGNGCYNNRFGNGGSDNIFGNHCFLNSFGYSLGSNSFGNYYNRNSLGNDVYYNSFGNNCSDNSFGNHCYHNSFGNSCFNNSFGNYCSNNSFENGCGYNSFRTSASTTGTLKDYCYNNSFDDGCSCNVIWNSNTTNSSISLKNININRGVLGTSSNFNFININTINSEKEININNYNGHIYIDYGDIFKVTYSELWNLRENFQLIPGRQYRIIDYNTTTSQENTISAEHPFDIIVTAIDNEILSEEAQAAQNHNNDNGYFNDSNLSAWKIWYSLDNDTDRFEWAGDERIETTTVETIVADSSECTIKSELIDGNTFITPFNFESCVWVDTDSDYADDINNHDIDELIYEWDYFDNPKTGNTELCIYKSDADLYEEEGCADSGDKYVYRGLVTVDGEEYDYWQKYELNQDGEYDDLAVNGNGYVFATTPRIVSNPEAYSSETITETIETVIPLEPKGVIYRMIDEFGNDLPYDFKNIMFVRYKLEAPEEYIAEDNDTLWMQQLCNNVKAMFDAGACSFVWAGVGDHDKYWEDANDQILSHTTGEKLAFFTFNTEGTDASLSGSTHGNKMQLSHTLPNNVFFGDNCYNNTFGDGCHDNSLGGACDSNSFGSDCYSNSLGVGCYDNSLGNGCCNNSFYVECGHNSFGNNCYNNSCGGAYYNNSFGDDCSTNAFGNSCYSNTFGNSCYSNTFGDESGSNSFGDDCHSNSFGNNCIKNSFGKGCHDNNFGGSCSYNSFDNICSYNSFGKYCRYNSFGNSCSYNSFVEGCDSNSFGNQCDNNTFGKNCRSNSFGNECYYNSFGNGYSDNSFGNTCHHNSFGNECYKNSFGDYCIYNIFGDRCANNSFGNSCFNNSFRTSASQTSSLKAYCEYNHFDDGCSYNVIWYSNTTSSSKLLKNINVNRGVSGTSSKYNFINIDTLNADYEIQVAKNSKGEIKIYCEADLIA